MVLVVSPSVFPYEFRISQRSLQQTMPTKSFSSYIKILRNIIVNTNTSPHYLTHRLFFLLYLQKNSLLEPYVFYSNKLFIHKGSYQSLLNSLRTFLVICSAELILVHSPRHQDRNSLQRNLVSNAPLA